MMSQNEARKRVLNTAEKIFHDRGYNGVSMRDIADALEMKQASLYYHVPEGKEQLFVEVTERGLLRHQKGLIDAIDSAEPALEAQLQAAAKWLMDHTPLKLSCMLESDIQALSSENSHKLTCLTYQSFFIPLTRLFHQAIDRGEIREFEPDQLAGSFLSIMDGISYSTSTGHTTTPKRELTENMIDIFLNGIYPRQEIS